MSHIFCSSCGSKHAIGARFCSGCGNAMGAFHKPASAQPRRSTEPSNVDEDGLPTVVVRPQKLEYEIVDKTKNRYSVSEVINQSPSIDREPRQKVNVKKMTKEEYLCQSLKECAQSRDFKDINES